jgi:hypothetical protein
MTVAATSGKELSPDCSCMRTLSPTCKPFQANGVMGVSVCPSAHRGERVSLPSRAVRHGGHSHHVACAAASRLTSPGKDNRHRPQRRDGGGRSTNVLLSACVGPASVWTWVMSLVPGHVERIDAVQRRATVRRSHRLRPTLRHVATCSRTTSTRQCQRPRSSRQRRFGVRPSRLLLPAEGDRQRSQLLRAYVGS